MAGRIRGLKITAYCDQYGLSTEERLVLFIVELQLKLLRARLADRHIELELSDAAKEHIAREDYDPVYDARPLKGFLQRQVETALSRKLLAGEIRDHSRVTVELKKGELVFEAAPLKKSPGKEETR
jgi:ATP-dependent Clp protease ATP-binding subunit ClpA